MPAQPQAKPYTADEYLALELASAARHEYRNGEVIPITGGTPGHNRIGGNLYIALSLGLKEQAYEVFYADQRLWIPDKSLYTYPDVMVLPKSLTLQEGRKDTVINPCFVAEILSNPPQNYDRGEQGTGF
ncbi:MAG: Uma2 family endonuclease [Leptolyngbya sp.]|nr:Uma2 family endonuclease [Leptolyngbya sp.]